MYLKFSNLDKYMNELNNLPENKIIDYQSQYRNYSNHQYFLPINTQKGLRRRDNNPLDIMYLEFD